MCVLCVCGVCLCVYVCCCVPRTAGKRGKVERVYFEIKPWWMEQWMERQVQESKKDFLQGLDVRSQREKLGAFIGFCEDTIFEVCMR